MKAPGTLWMVGGAFLGTTLYALAEELIEPEKSSYRFWRVGRLERR